MTREIILPERIEFIGAHSLEVMGYLHFVNINMICVAHKALGLFV